MVWRFGLATFLMAGSLACSTSDEPSGSPGGSGSGGADTGGEGGGALGGTGGGSSGTGGAGVSGGAGAAGSLAGSAGAGQGGAGPAGAAGVSGPGGASGAGGEAGSAQIPGWTLVWADEFDGTTLDLTAWNVLDRPSPWNDELQYYSPDNVTLEDGALVIEAREERREDRDYTSGRINTEGKHEWTYGLFVARIQLPATVAMWPAFWLLGSGGHWPDAGEIDIMEAKGRLPEEIGGTAHWNEGGHQWDSGNYYFPDGEDITGWHEYAIEWSPTELVWTVDGNEFHTFGGRSPFDHDFFIILNLAVGGMFDGGRTPPDNMEPQRMRVDWVRVYQRP